MANTNRRSMLQLLVGAAAVPAVPATLHQDAAAIIAKARTVTQAELQSVLDFYNAAELLAADIRARLEAGATLEHGKLGVSTQGKSSLEWLRENGGIGGWEESDLEPISIEPVEKLDFDRSLLEKYGARPGEFVMA